MSECASIRAQLADYVADGEPRTSGYASLRAHLARCASCRAYAESLRHVEDALLAMPLTVAPPGLSGLILDRIADERQVQEEEWQMLPWSIWLPVLAMLFAVLIISMSLPGQMIATALPPEAQGVVMPLHELLSVEHLPFERPANPDLFWAVWIGGFCTPSGLGNSLSLFSWTAGDSRSLEDVEEHVEEAIGRLRSRTRRAG